MTQDRAPRFGETSEMGSVPDTKEGTNEGRGKSPAPTPSRRAYYTILLTGMALGSVLTMIFLSLTGSLA